MRRRVFVAFASGAIAAYSLASRAQQVSRIRRIGIVHPYSERDAEAQLLVGAFREQLARLGWGDGRDVSFEYRWAGSGVEQIRAYSREMVALAPEVILARATPVTAALKRETGAIPIVFVVVADPVGDQLVESLAKPGGNITGIMSVGPWIGGKWVELLRGAFPDLSQVSVMYNPNTAGAGLAFLREIETAARLIQVKVIPATVSNAVEIEGTIASIARVQGAGLIVVPDVTMLANRFLIMSLSVGHRVPVIYPWASAPDAGGLIAYGVDYVDLYRRAAGYVDRILRGAKPGELPIQQPAKFELAINKRTAATLGIKIPESILVRADRVIE
jgi:putative ABC transport system substrate-binding protein